MVAVFDFPQGPADAASHVPLLAVDEVRWQPLR